MNYANRKVLMPYWVNTSSDEHLREFFEISRDKTSEMLERLILGKDVTIQYNEKITFLDLNVAASTDAVNVIGNFLLFSGYLTTCDKSEFELTGYINVKIPNAEVKKVYTDIISKWTAEDAKMPSQNLYFLSKAILAEEKIEKLLNQALQSMSLMDEHEKFYHGYMLGLFVNFLNREYIVKSNREAGEGRFDIMIEKYDRSVGIVVEFKLAKEDEDIEQKALDGKNK